MVGVDEAGDRRLLLSAPRLRPWFSVGAAEEVHTQVVPFSPFPSAPSPPLPLASPHLPIPHPLRRPRHLRFPFRPCPNSSLPPLPKLPRSTLPLLSSTDPAALPPDGNDDDDAGRIPPPARSSSSVMKFLPAGSRNAAPFLTFETKGLCSAVVQDVPISKPLSRADVLRLQSAC